MNSHTLISQNPRIYKVHLPQKTDEIYFDVYLNSGSVNEPEKFKEYTHLFEHYVLGSIQNQARKINGETSSETTHFSLISDTKNFPRKARIFLDAIYNPSFEDKDIFEYERSSTQGELREKWSHIHRQVTEMIAQKLYGPACPYFIPTSKKLSSVEKMGPKELSAYYQEFFSKIKPIFIYGGFELHQNIDEKIVQIIKSYQYGNIEKKTSDFPICTPASEQFHIIIHPAVQYGTMVRIYFPGLSLQRPFAERLALSMFCRIFSQDSPAGMFKKVRSLGIYEFQAAHWVFEQFGFLEIKTFLAREQSKTFFPLLKTDIEHAKKNLIPKEELQNDIEKRKRDFYESWLSNDGRYASICDDVIHETKIYEPDMFNTLLDSIHPEKIQAITKECLDIPQSKICAIGSEVQNDFLDPARESFGE